MIYLDNNATTQMDPAVAETMQQVWLSGPMNPSSQHASGRAARARLDQAAAEIGELLGADVQQPGGPQLIFTSGGTEANNLAIDGLADHDAALIVSEIEHPSVLEVARRWQAAGREVHWIPVDRQGVADLRVLEQQLREPHAKPPLVCLMTANNETGVLQPVAAAAELCRRFDALLHVDATQSVGKCPTDFAALNAASMVFAAHKFHGPVGIGGLLLAPGVQLTAQWQGGAQQLGMRPGTEAVPLAVGAAVALRIACQSMATTTPAIAGLRDLLETQLTERLDGLVIHGRDAPRLPGTSCIGFPDVDRQSMLISLDMAGLACSSGSACASGSSEPSYVLQAMQVPAATIDGSLRFGLSKFSTEPEIFRAIELISLAYNRLRPHEDVEK
ncbi:cysteine desulfurase family protein [Roseimaritima ulvae]|uniref:Cysteine desulfurase n=1 Tax=Roseimaritima ulvae TaxID=980254 RepID=A0A5B9R0F3_9BACT|nr:cysteine desulfurase family protein [Roseimaritima ulvae]QEG43862.1 Cysteine desulfurase [Roseimaritima ulvae]